MDFSFVKVKDLIKFADSCFNLEGYHVAITPWRALSQANNPHADPDDIALVYTCDEKGQICGFIGALPVRLWNKQNAKCAWISCWWVKPGIKKGLSNELLNIFINNYDLRILFSDMPSERLAGKFQKAANSTVKERSGYHIWIRFNIAGKLLVKYKSNRIILHFIKYSGLYFLFKVVDILGNLLLFPVHQLFMLTDNKKVIINKIDFPSAEDFIFINNHAGNDVFIPQLKDMEWYSKYPWLIRKNKKNAKIGSKYYFSSFAERNELYWFKIRVNNQTEGMIMITEREGVAKTQLVYISSGCEVPVVKKVRNYILKEFRITDLISYNGHFVKVLNMTWFPWLRKRKIKRYYGVSQKLIAFIGIDFTMQDGMGDYIFT